jgi:hypothetical protein
MNRVPDSIPISGLGLMIGERERERKREEKICLGFMRPTGPYTFPEAQS